MIGPIDVLIVEDDVSMSGALRVYLEAKGWIARVAGDVDEAKEIIRTRFPKCVLLDLRLPKNKGDSKGDGATLIPFIRATLQDCKIIICSGEPRATDEVGADAVYVKAFTPFDELVAEIVEAVGPKAEKKGE